MLRRAKEGNEWGWEVVSEPRQAGTSFLSAVKKLQSFIVTELKSECPLNTRKCAKALRLAQGRRESFWGWSSDTRWGMRDTGCGEFRSEQ